MTDLKRSWKTDQEWMYKVDYSFQLWLYFEKFESYLGTRIYRQSAFRLWFLMSPSAVRETICVQSSETQAMYWHRPQSLFKGLQRKIKFSHSLHALKWGTADCSNCRYFTPSWDLSKRENNGLKLLWYFLKQYVLDRFFLLYPNL